MPHPVGRRALCWRNAVPCRTRVAAESTALLHSPWRCRGCLCALSDAWGTSSTGHLQGGTDAGWVDVACSGVRSSLRIRYLACSGISIQVSLQIQQFITIDVYMLTCLHVNIDGRVPCPQRSTRRGRGEACRRDRWCSSRLPPTLRADPGEPVSPHRRLRPPATLDERESRRSRS